MIYRPEHIALWPRVLTAASASQQLRTILIDLMQRGAALTVNDTGGLRLDQGDCPDYKVIRASKLAPQEAAVRQVLATARGPHPWELALVQAYDALRKRCQEVEEVMHVATEARDAQTIAARSVQILRLHWWGELLSRVFVDAGLGHEADVAHHRAEAAMHGRILTAAGQAVCADPGPYPVDTADGWFWLTDGTNTTPAPVDLGTPHGTKQPESDEPVITAMALTEALMPITEQLLRKAV